MNATALAVAPLVQARDDFFHGLRDTFDIALLVTANRVLALLYDVAVPARTGHVPGRIRWLNRYDFIVFIDQRYKAPLPQGFSRSADADDSTRI